MGPETAAPSRSSHRTSLNTTSWTLAPRVMIARCPPLPDNTLKPLGVVVHTPSTYTSDCRLMPLETLLILSEPKCDAPPALAKLMAMALPPVSQVSCAGAATNDSAVTPCTKFPSTLR